MKSGSFQRLMFTWTLGHLKVLRRRIDFIMCGQEMRFTSAHATCNLDLGSDISFDLGVRRSKTKKCFRCVQRWKPPLDQQGVPQTYHAILQDELGVKKPATLHGLEDVLQQSVRPINTTSKLPKPRPLWQHAVLQDLLQRRKAARDRSERANLSKVIRKHLRQNMRKRRNARVSQIRAEFQDLGRLDSAHTAPIRREETASLGPTPDMFRSCLGNILMSDIGHEMATLACLDDSDCLGLVPPFSLQELGAVLTDVHYGNIADVDGMVAEMFRYSNILLWKYLQFDDGFFETSWQHTVCTMLPKSSDKSQPNHWGPIALLKKICKFFPVALQQNSNQQIRQGSAPVVA